MDIQLRKKFLEIYDVLLINIFEEKVFDDTSYTICSFIFSRKENNIQDVKIKVDIYPKKLRNDEDSSFEIKLNEDNNYTFGGEIYNLNIGTKYTVNRLIKGDKKNTNILVKCIDDNLNNKINMKIVDDDNIYIDDTPNKTARTYATLSISPHINITKQKKLVDKFNKLLNEYRTKYNSLFLANYRESKDIARKRISFELIYRIVNHILTDMRD